MTSSHFLRLGKWTLAVLACGLLWTGTCGAQEQTAPQKEAEAPAEHAEHAGRGMHSGHGAEGEHGPQGGGRGFRGGRGPEADAAFTVDRDTFHFLLSHHDQLHRQVTNLDNGVETLTESDDPEVTKKLKEHVKAMYSRLEEQRPIRMRDPLFAEVFRYAEKITMKLEETEHGLKVTETSDDPWAAQLIRAHAAVVTGFIASGFEEAHRDHPLPPRPESAVSVDAASK